ncbi:hypothetical protein [Chroococcidiopsis sp.]
MTSNFSSTPQLSSPTPDSHSPTPDSHSPTPDSRLSITNHQQLQTCQ